MGVILSATFPLPVLSCSQDGCCISRHHVCIQGGRGWSKFPGLHQLGLFPFLSGKQKLSQKCPRLFLTSNGSELGHWLRLAAREAGKVHSREKVGIKDSGKHTCGVCHSPLPTLLSLFQQIFPGRAPGGRKWWLSGHGFKAFQWDVVDRNSGSSKKRIKISPSGIVGEALGFGVGFPGFQNLLDLGTREDVHHTGLLAMLRARVPPGHVWAGPLWHQ